MREGREGEELAGLRGVKKMFKNLGRSGVGCRVIGAGEPGGVCSNPLVAAPCSGHRPRHHIPCFVHAAFEDLPAGAFSESGSIQILPMVGSCWRIRASSRSMADSTCRTSKPRPNLMSTVSKTWSGPICMVKMSPTASTAGSSPGIFLPGEFWLDWCAHRRAVRRFRVRGAGRRRPARVR